MNQIEGFVSKKRVSNSLRESDGTMSDGRHVEAGSDSKEMMNLCNARSVVQYGIQLEQ